MCLYKLYIYIYTLTHTYIYIWALTCMHALCKFVCNYACIYACMHVCSYVYKFISIHLYNIYIYIYMHVYIYYVSLYVIMHACIYVLCKLCCFLRVSSVKFRRLAVTLSYTSFIIILCICAESFFLNS